MYSNQDIFRIHTSCKINSYDAGTALVMFPLKLETRFLNRPVKKFYDKHNALFIFQALWDILRAYRDNNKESLKHSIDKLVEETGKIEILYREDSTRLLMLLKAFQRAMPEYKTILSQVESEIEKAVVITATKDNRATILVDKANRMLKRLRSIKKGYSFNGNDRFHSSNSPYSIAPYFKSIAKHLAEVRRFLETLPSEAATIPFLDPQQRRSIVKTIGEIRSLIAECEKGTREGVNLKIDNPQIRPTLIEAAYKAISELKDKHIIGKPIITKEQKLSGREKNILKWYEYVSAEYDKLKAISDNYSEPQGLKTRKHCYRYTLPATMLMLWYLKGAKFKNRFHNSLCRIAEHTLFNYLQELEWLRAIIEDYNTNISNIAGVKPLSVKLLNKQARFIRKRKMSYIHNEKCLCIRIYPDELAVTQMNRALTKREIADAENFLKEYFPLLSKDNTDNYKRAAWDKLCRKYPPYQAAWIVRCRVLEPNAAPITENQIFSIPVTELMPNRFAVQAVIKTVTGKEQTICRYGNRLPEVLQVGLDLNKADNFDPQEIASVGSNGQLKLNGNLRWMTDYDEAERIGMAITIPLSAFQAQKKEIRDTQLYEFSAIYVTGVKEDLDIYNDKGSELIKRILEAHLYSETGLDLIKAGTPTNILTDDTQTTYDTSESRQHELYFKIVSNSLKEVGSRNSRDATVKEYIYTWKDPASDSENDADIINKIFKITDNSTSFNEVEHSDNADITNARAINRWLIDKLAELNPDNGLLKLLSSKGDESLNNYFCDCVLPQGIAPAIRIGAQPYGILPVGDFRNMSYLGSYSVDNLGRMLVYLTDKWNNIAEQNRVVESSKGETKKFLQLMGKTPYSTDFYLQDVLKIENFLSPRYFRGMSHSINPIAEMEKIEFRIFDRYLDALNYIPLKDEEYSNKFFSLDNIDSLSQEAKDLLKEAKEIVKSNSCQEISDSEALRLIVSFFDLFKYRLDAWMLGILNYRLTNLMSENRYRVAIGCFGWIFSLKEPAPSEKKNFLGEYILAPSINQAITAGILRGAYDNCRDTDEAMSMNINLSSKRVRKAMRIIEGVRNGLSVGAMLGADLERLLHDAYKNEGTEMDVFILPLRKSFPLYKNAKQDEKTDSAAISVINGSLLIKSLRDTMGNNSEKYTIEEYFSKNIKGFYKWCGNHIDSKFSNPTTADKKKIDILLHIFQQIYDSFDAIMDIMLSENIYQLCQGNSENVIAIMNALNNDTMLPIPKVTEIPAANARIENKVISLLPHKIEEEDTNSMLSQADPYINEWCRSIFGKLEMFNEGVSPAELLYLSSDRDGFIAYLQHLSPNRSEELIAEFDRVELIAESIRETLGMSHTIKPDDFIYKSPDSKIESNVDIDEIECRYKELEIYIKSLISELDNIVSVWGEKPEYDTVLWKCYRIGLSEIPNIINRLQRADETDSTDKLEETTKNVESDSKLDYILKIVAQLKSNIDSAQKCIAEKCGVAEYTKAMRTLTVANLTVVPSITLSCKQLPLEVWCEQCANENFFSNISEERLEEWVCDMGDVRPAMQNLFQQRLYGGWFLDKQQSIRAVQLPFTTDDNLQPAQQYGWLGCEVENESQVFDANVYLVANAEEMILNASDRAKGYKEIRGIVLDFWVEKIPLREQTSGLTFHFDQPDAEPPQAILIAMHNNSGWNSRWTEKQVIRSIKCALHLVKSRAVEPDHIKNDSWGSALFPFPIINDPFNNSKEPKQ